MAKLVIYGSAPVLKTIQAIYGRQFQSSELTNEEFNKAEQVVEPDTTDETVDKEDVTEGTTKKGKGRK